MGRRIQYFNFGTIQLGFGRATVAMARRTLLSLLSPRARSQSAWQIDRDGASRRSRTTRNERNTRNKIEKSDSAKLQRNKERACARAPAGKPAVLCISNKIQAVYAFEACACHNYYYCHSVFALLCPLSSSVYAPRRSSFDLVGLRAAPPHICTICVLLFASAYLFCHVIRAKCADRSLAQCVPICVVCEFLRSPRFSAFSRISSMPARWGACVRVCVCLA